MLTLQAEKRQIFGKKLKATRLSGQLPAVMYGAKDKAEALFVPTKEFKKIFTTAGESTVIALTLAEGKKEVLINDVVFHPVSGEPLHADFYVIDKTKIIKIKVPLRFEGTAPAVKDLGATLVKVKHELEIETLPLSIPHDIEVDITALTALDSQITVADLKVAKDVKIIDEATEVVASVAVAKEEEETPAAPIDLSAIEVEKKGKKEDEEGAVAESAE
jgi:large subunit ribosomal protein L25